MHNYVNVAIVGARGYSGLDLTRILLRHPNAKIAGCFATDAAFRLSDYLPEELAASVPVLPISELLPLCGKLHTVFLATPAETSAELAPKLLEAGVRVVDLSGAFRLAGTGVSDRETLYKDWYAYNHPCASLIDQANYGLVPWAPAVTTEKPVLISNPGCYATSILMATIPVLKEGLIRPETLVIDAKSGTSGAGRKAADHLTFTEVEGECLPYRIGKHQHLPEIKEKALQFSGKEVDPFFTPHLLNVRRGIIAGIYARLAPGTTAEKVGQAFAKAYEGYPLVRVAAIDVAKQKTPGSPLLSLKRVVGSARTHITYAVETDKLFIYSCIDNLLKGAASQAVENFNRLLGIAPETGLTQMEGVL